MPWRPELEKELREATDSVDVVKMCFDGGPIPNKQAVEVALRYLSTSIDVREGWELLGLLRRSPISYDGSFLCRYFEREPANRWSTADIMAVSPAEVPCAWIDGALLDRSYGKDREMLCHAIVKFCPPERARLALRAVFEEFPGHACKGLGQVGTREDLDMMLEATTRITGWQARAIESKGIRPLAKRLGVPIANEKRRKRD